MHVSISLGGVVAHVTADDFSGGGSSLGRAVGATVGWRAYGPWTIVADATYLEVDTDDCAEDGSCFNSLVTDQRGVSAGARVGAADERLWGQLLVGLVWLPDFYETPAPVGVAASIGTTWRGQAPGGLALELRASSHRYLDTRATNVLLLLGVLIR